MIKFNVWTLNNGTLILDVTENDVQVYAHAYDDPAQIATDVKTLIDGDNASDWDGNEMDELGNDFSEWSQNDHTAWGKAGKIEFSERISGYAETEFAKWFEK